MTQEELDEVYAMPTIPWRPGEREARIRRIFSSRRRAPPLAPVVPIRSAPRARSTRRRPVASTTRAAASDGDGDPAPAVRVRFAEHDDAAARRLVASLLAQLLENPCT